MIAKLIIWILIVTGGVFLVTTPEQRNDFVGDSFDDLVDDFIDNDEPEEIFDEESNVTKLVYGMPYEVVEVPCEKDDDCLIFCDNCICDEGGDCYTII